MNVVVVEDDPLPEEEKKEDTNNEKTVTYASYNKDGLNFSVNYDNINNTTTVAGTNWMPF